MASCGFSGCKPAAIERQYRVIHRLWSGLFGGHSDGGMKSGVALERIDRLLCTVSCRCRILLEGEVVRELFDVRQKENFTVLLTVYFHKSINEMEICASQ